MSKAIERLANFSQKQTTVCVPCCAHELGYENGKPVRFCALAQLEALLGEIPTYGQAEDHDISTERISENCPNGYINEPSRRIR